jgi:molecular chaperone GrpE
MILTRKALWEVGFLEKHKKEIADEADNKVCEEAFSLEAQMERLRFEASQNLEGWKRAQADFQNYKKRMENERSETAVYFRAETVSSFLSVADNFARALANVPLEIAQSQWFSGFKMLQSSFEKALQENLVQSFGKVGEDFDPNIHQALAQEKGPTGKITQVLSQGYQTGGRILREASVVVGQEHEN